MAGSPLEELGQATAEAVAGVLQMLCGEQASLGAVAAVPEGGNPFGMVPMPAVFAAVGYVGASTGGNTFAVSVEGARGLAAAMMGQDPAQVNAGEPLSELEMSALGEAMNQMMATAAAAMSSIVGQEIDIDPPRTEVVETMDDVFGAPSSGALLVSASFTVCGHPARLVQAVPRPFLVRMSQALEERAERAAADHPVAAGDGAPSVSADMLRRVPLRVWAEIGRTRMPMSRAVGIQPGEVIELDRGPDEPVDLFVNGRRFATGTLLRVDDADWAVRIDWLASTNPSNN